MGLVWSMSMVCGFHNSASRMIDTDLAPVKFRMIVFRPFKGEIMLGKISSGTEHGIKGMFELPFQCCITNNPTVGLEFFNDILIPPQMLMDNSRL